MGDRAVYLAWIAKGMPPLTRLILLKFAAWANDQTGEGIYSSQEYLAWRFEVGERTIREHLTKLEDGGLIVSTRRGRGLSNTYVLQMSALAALEGEPWEVPAESAGQDSEVPAESAGPAPAKSAALDRRNLPVPKETELETELKTELASCGGVIAPLGITECPIRVPCWLHTDDRDLYLDVDAQDISTVIGDTRRDILWEAVEVVCKSRAETKPEGSKWGKAINKALRPAGATPRQVLRRGAEWHRRYQGRTLTPTALSANWGSLAHQNSSSQPVADTVAAVRAAARAATDATARTE